MLKYRPISVQVDAPTTLETAITVSDANVVRVTNTSTSTKLISLVNDGTTVGTMTLVGSEVAFIDKPKAWGIFAADNTVKLVSVSYPS